MSQSSNKSIEQATEIIERFGGIRPMAKKIDVAVTTIQGWKKRDVIPAARRGQVIQAAQEHGVDLTDILSDAKTSTDAANQNTAETNDTASFENELRDAQPKTPEPAVEPEAVRKIEKPKNVEAAIMPPVDNLAEQLKQTERKAVRKSVLFNAVITAGVVGAVCVVAYVLQPWNTQTQDIATKDQVTSLEQDIDAVKSEQSLLSRMIPSDLQDKIDNIQTQVQETKARVDAVVEQASTVTEGVLGDDAGTIEQRMTALGTNLQVLSEQNPRLQSLLSKVQGLQNSTTGQLQLETTMTEIRALVENYGGLDGPLDDALVNARERSTAMGQTFENVPADDLKAAALLLTMSQLRDSLNRNNDAFDEDLALLMNMVGDKNPALSDSLQRLSPHAQSGILTPSGLSGEFKTLAGEAVVASLKGEDVSLKEKAVARFNQLFQIEKEGEMVTGTQTQIAISSAEKHLETGDLQSAIAEVQRLDGPAADILAPWLRKAQATVTAQNVQAVLSQSISGVMNGTGRLIKNDETGINIYQPSVIPNRPGQQLITE